MYPKKVNQVADDIESFLHLLCIFALRFHRHNKMPQELKGLLDSTYDTCSFEHGYWVGGSGKWDLVTAGTVPFKLQGNDTFASLLATLAAICKSHYASIDKEALQRYAAGPAPAPPAIKAFKKPTRRYKYADALDNEDVIPRTVEPTPAVSAAPLLATHRAFCVAITKALRDGEWPTEDKENDKSDLIKWSDKESESLPRSALKHSSQALPDKATKKAKAT